MKLLTSLSLPNFRFSIFDFRLGRATLREAGLFLFLLIAVLLPLSSSLAGGFAASDTIVVTNSASSTNVFTSHPQFSGANCAWHPSLIMANFHDSPYGQVLRVDHVRSNIVNRLIVTNATISITNNIYLSPTNAASSLVWNPSNSFTVVPASDFLIIRTSSTNAEIMIFKYAE